MKTSEILKQKYDYWHENAVKSLTDMLVEKKVRALTLNRAIIVEEPHLLGVGIDDEGLIVENTFQYDARFHIELTELSPDNLIWLVGEVDSDAYKVDEEIILPLMN